MKLRIWWIQGCGKQFTASVKSLVEGRKMLTLLTDYDQFQVDNNLKPDCCSLGGLEVFDGGWMEWENEDGQNVYDLSVNDLKVLDSLERATR